jgi:hypothetical protein
MEKRGERMILFFKKGNYEQSINVESGKIMCGCVDFQMRRIRFNEPCKHLSEVMNLVDKRFLSMSGGKRE